MVEIEVDKAKEGLKTAVAALHDPNALPPDDQLTLLPDLPLETALEAQGVRRGRGRPPGAKNKNTEAWREFLLSKGRSPLEVLMETYSCTPAQLAMALGRTAPLTFDQAVELFKLQIQAAKELAPYLHQKMPQAVDLGDGAGLIQLVINQGGAAAQGVSDAGAMAFTVLNTPDEENQLVSNADFEDATQSGHTANGDDEVNA